jgi:hypothetical protein
MIACDIRVARKKVFSIFENVNPGKDNSDEADTEKNPQWQDRIGMRRNDQRSTDSFMNIFAMSQNDSRDEKDADRMSDIASRRPALHLTYRR